MPVSPVVEDFDFLFLALFRGGAGLGVSLLLWFLVSISGVLFWEVFP